MASLGPRLLILALLGVLGVYAAPASLLKERATTTALSSGQVSTFKSYSYYASTGYCAASTTIKWSCGAKCNANPAFIPVASGGDGNVVQFWFVGYDPTLQSVIVSHQGSKPNQIQSLITDATIAKTALNATLFPGVSSSVHVHSGFANEQAKTATAILSAVQAAIQSYGAKKVTTVGHSLGGAIALLDALYLPLHLSAGLTYQTIVYGMPRVGNSAFATYVDSHASLTHINNKKDYIPILPGKFMGFAHPAGEVHVVDSGTWVSCTGHDNADSQCIVGDVSSIFTGNESDHDGPYDGVLMGDC